MTCRIIHTDIVKRLPARCPARCIERTLFSICNDETRFHPDGVFFESDGSKTRRSPPMVTGRGECTINGPKLSAGLIIPKKGLLEIKKVLEQGSSRPPGGADCTARVSIARTMPATA